jgi:hypothetical protein
MPQQRISGAKRNAAFDLWPISGFDGRDRIVKCPSQDALADGPQHEAEGPPSEVLALAHHDGIHISRPVGPPREGVTCPELPPHRLESVVFMTTRLRSDQS